MKSIIVSHKYHYSGGDNRYGYNGIQLINEGIRVRERSGQIESLEQQMENLSEIVGRLLEWVPTKDWIDVCGLEYTLEYINDA